MFKTKNDLSEATRAKVVELLNARLADCTDLQTQTKQAHWNVKGPNFIALHELFDKINEDVEDYVDDIAERAIQLGGVAEGTARTVAKRSSLSEYPANAVDGRSHVEALSTALATFGKAARKAINDANDLGDWPKRNVSGGPRCPVHRPATRENRCSGITLCRYGRGFFDVVLSFRDVEIRRKPGGLLRIDFRDSICPLPIRQGTESGPSKQHKKARNPMAKQKKRATAAPPVYPERKWGPFAGGVSVAVWLQETSTAEGTRYFRSVTVRGRRFLDRETSEWKDGALRPTHIPALVLGLCVA